jgi:CheY-like chemotaxis protein
MAGERRILWMRVLIVEDDPLVREMAVEVLTDEGFDVIAAETGEEALAHCREHAADLLFTDIRLPGELNGWDVAEHCRKSNPDIPVIYATGFNHMSPRPVPGSIWFQKPYRPEQILAAVRSMAPPDAAAGHACGNAR